MNAHESIVQSSPESRFCKDTPQSFASLLCLISLAQCLAPTNGNFYCPNGTATSLIGDSCTFSCNAGYELQGSNNGTCLSNQSWSGGDPICVPLNCTNNGTLSDGAVLSQSCRLQYQSQCTVSYACDEGFTGYDVTYLCNVTSDPTMVDWVPIFGVDVMCERGLLSCTAKHNKHCFYFLQFSAII